MQEWESMIHKNEALPEYIKNATSFGKENRPDKLFHPITSDLSKPNTYQEFSGNFSNYAVIGCNRNNVALWKTKGTSG
jgi:hypothetical protein